MCRLRYCCLSLHLRAPRRFLAKEAAALRPLEGRTTFQPLRECVRRVHADACIELETNRYSVPWRLIGEAVTVLVNEQVRVLHAGEKVAVHMRLAAQRRNSIHRQHLIGIVGSEPRRPTTGERITAGGAA